MAGASDDLAHVDVIVNLGPNGIFRPRNDADFLPIYLRWYFSVTFEA
jgi:hypothetical protein